MAHVWKVVICALLSTAVLEAGSLVPTYGTYFGGTGDTNVAVAVAVGPSGEIVVAGYTTSETLPGTANAFQPTKATGFPDNRDVFIAKFDPTGTVLQWATFLGGAGDDEPTAVKVGTTGNIYVIGSASPNFPVTPGAYLATYPSEGGAGFAAKISADGRSLIYSTLLPGGANALAIDAAGDAYLGGVFKPSVITPGALGNGANPVTAEDSGIFLVALNERGTGLVFGAYLGGGGFNGSNVASVAIGPAGNVYVAGFTTYNADNFPTTSNAFEAQFPGGVSASNPVPVGFIAEVSPAGSQLLYGTYFGPPYSYTKITDLAVAPDGSLYLSGPITTTAMWATPGAYMSTPSPGFIARLTPGSSVLDSFSFLPEGGSPALVIASSRSDSMYVDFSPSSGYGVPAGFSVVELSTPAFGLVSTFTAPSLGFLPSGAVVAGSHSLWLVGGFGTGGCASCTLANLISGNAYQLTPSSTSESAVLLELTDISPTVAFVSSAATGSSPFASNQLISIYGSQLGPSVGSGLQLGPGGVVTASNGGTQVTFDGTQAPILYTSAGQVNTVIPCEVAGHSSTQIVVTYQGAQSPSFTLPLSPTAPGIFTFDGSGKGQGAVLNQDYSFNGPNNPAPRGSTIIFYATGIGPTSPCVDGQTYASGFPQPMFPVFVGIGGIGAHVSYAGQAPYLVSGVAQINAVVPSGAPTGSVPLTLLVDGALSPSGVTIAVK